MLAGPAGARAACYACQPRVAFHALTAQLLRTKQPESQKRSRKEPSQSLSECASRPADSGSAKASDVMRKCTDAEESSAHSGSSAPTCSSDAIQRGLSACEAEEYSIAIEYFTRALELPGKGVVSIGLETRHACPSEAEERAALYNLACCYAQLHEVESGIAVLNGLLEAGFDEFDMLRSDEKLAELRSSPDFEDLLTATEEEGAVVLYGGRKRRKSIDERPPRV